MRVAIECAGFTPGEADQLRRAMATFKFTGGVIALPGQAGRGHGRRAATTQDFAERTFKQLEGFGSYGFPESHAASFALIAYASSWMKCHHPDVFCCRAAQRPADGLLRAGADRARCAASTASRCGRSDVNALALGLHAGADARRTRFAVRLGLRMVQGPRQCRRRPRSSPRAATSPSPSIEDLWRRAGVPVAALERLAEADAFRLARARPPRGAVGDQGLAR